MRIFGVFILGVLGLQSIAADAPPKISDAHLAGYYRAERNVARLQLTIREAQDMLSAAQQELRSAISVLQEDCGKGWTPSQDQQSTTVVCTEIPAKGK